MKRLDIFTWVAIQVLITGIVMMAFSFIPDYLHGFFGDWHCDGGGVRLVNDKYTEYGCQYSGEHSAQWHWGYRHWIWFAMGFVYFILNFARVVTKIERWDK